MTFLAEPDVMIESADEFDIVHSKFGGRPYSAWTDAKLDDIVCAECSGKMYLVAQLYAPLREDAHRVVYLFVCSSAADSPCRKDGRCTWRLFRAHAPVEEEEEEVEEEEEEEEEEEAKTRDDWTGDNDDDDDDIEAMLQMRDSNASGTAPNKQKRKQKQKKKMTMKKKTAEGANARKSKRNYVETQPELFPGYWMAVYEEPTSQAAAAAVARKKEDEHAMKLWKSYQDNMAASSSNANDNYDEDRDNGDDDDEDEDEDEDGDEDEEGDDAYDNAQDGARMHRTFMRRLSRCSSQCLRYGFGLRPLWATAQYAGQTKGCGFVGGQCSLCGAQRVMELQLMLPLIAFIESFATSSGSNGNSNAVDGADVKDEQSLFKLYKELHHLFHSGMEWNTVVCFVCGGDCKLKPGQLCEELCLVD